MIKKIATLFLLLCMTVQLFVGTPAVALAEDTDYNLGFESDMDGWTQYGIVTVEEQKVVNVVTTGGENIDWTIIPHGIKMAALTPSGSDYSMEDLKNVMKLSDDSMDYIVDVFPGITNVAYIYRDIELLAGQQISIAWNYVATDYAPFNDASLLCAANTTAPEKLPIINGYYSDVSILGATVLGTGNYSTGSYGSTGWQTATVKAAFAGTYRLGFVVYNLDDMVRPPYLFVEDLAGSTLKNGEEFEPIEPDDNPPPMQPVLSLNYDVTLFNEAAANDGSVTEKATLTLTNETFAGDVDSIISDVTFENTPAGLTPVVKKTGDNTAELSFTGKASPSGESSDINNFRVTFGNSAFTGGDASKVLGSDTAILGFDFDNSLFTVKFYDANGNLLSTQTVESGSDATPPTAPDISGYKFAKWSASYEDINGDVNIEAVYAANTDTPYLVNYYIPNPNGEGYVLKEKTHDFGTTDTTVTAIVKEYSGYTMEKAMTTLTGKVAGDGSLVLSVYYAKAVVAPDTGDASGSMLTWMIAAVLSLLGFALAIRYKQGFYCK